MIYANLLEMRYAHFTPQLINIREQFPSVFTHTPRNIIDFDAIKPRDVLLQEIPLGGIYDYFVGHWGCGTTPEFFTEYDDPYSLAFATRDGVPTKVMSRLAAITNNYIGLYFRAYGSNDYYKYSVKPYERRHRLIQIQGYTLPNQIREKLQNTLSRADN